MQGRILNIPLLKKVADLLNLEGVKRFPAVLDLNDIKAVIDIGRVEGLATPGAGQGSWESLQIDPVISSQFVERAVLLDGNGTDAFRVDSLVAELEFANNAAVIAFATELIRLKISLTYEGGDPGEIPIVVANPWFVPTSGQIRYYWSLKGSNAQIGGNPDFGLGINHASTWDGAVPAVVGLFGLGVVRLTISVDTIAGSNFPNPTTLKVYLTYRRGTNGVVPVRG